MFPELNSDNEFETLCRGRDIVRGKLGDEGHAAALDPAARAKARFLDDPAEDNGKTSEGIKLIFEIEDIIQSVRNRRTKAGIKDEEGRVSGD